ncbi:MAG: hypothetical protein GY716_03035 [bacterium]|nr:hypothetical protein [bacterium]
MSTGRTVLKIGCFGALGLVAIVVAVFAALYGLAVVQVRDDQRTSTELTREQPAARPEVGGAPDEPALHVLLDVKDADITLVVGEPGSELRVDATFDDSKYALEQEDTSIDGAPAWSVRLRRDGGSGSLMRSLQMLAGAKNADLRIRIPPDLPVALHGNLDRGEIDIDLAGLSVTAVDLEVANAVLQLDTSEPIEPIERLTLDMRITNLTLRNLGNASPRRTKVETRLGRVDMDLAGAWRRDADLQFEMRLTGGRVRVPQGVRVEGLELDATLPEDRESSVPTLRFRVEKDVGDLRFER